MTTTLNEIAFWLAALAAVLFVWNLLLYRRARPAATAGAAVSVLIPARNEEASIRGALASVLANKGVELEVVVLDDGSTDRTADIVRAVAGTDSRVRLSQAPLLPPGWCGKQHACSVLATRARYEVLCFMDADVRLEPYALARMAAHLERSGVALLSGFPRQVTGTFLERLLIPLIHFVLLAYLPVAGLRHTRLPGFGAGCGQLMMVRRDAYANSGGHRAIRATLHDGLRLPASFRRAGYRTDLVDATDLASCRMYTNARDVWFGLAKNATEGMAAPVRILPFSFLLFAGQVLPFLLLNPAAIALVYLPRLIAVVRFRQSPGSALLHPLGVTLLLMIQWYALGRKLLGKPSAWKGRAYAAGSAQAG